MALSALRQAVTLELDKRQRVKASQRKILTYFPDEGPLRRELYVKHQEFFAAGAQHRERLMLAANRVGKTEGVGGYETTLHLTGWYPHWWIGRRFKGPISGWCAGDTGKTVFDILQKKLMGPPGQWGTGLIPAETIERTVASRARVDALDAVYVKHKSGGTSVLSFKSYEQGRESFQGTEQHLIWLDEEPPLPIYTECLLRTMATTTFEGGMMMLTFTPLRGMSEVVLSYLPGGKIPESGVCPVTS